MSQNDKNVYYLNQHLPYTTATVKKLEETLKTNNIDIPKKSQKPALYKLFYYLCQSKNHSIIPKNKEHLTLAEYIKLHTNKSSNKKRRKEKTKPPTKRVQIEKNQAKTVTEMDLSGNTDEYDTMPETDTDDTTSHPPQPIGFSTPNEVISFEDEIYENNHAQNPISFDDQMFENNSKCEEVSLEDDIYK